MRLLTLTTGKDRGRYIKSSSLILIVRPSGGNLYRTHSHLRNVHFED